MKLSLITFTICDEERSVQLAKFGRELEKSVYLGVHHIKWCNVIRM